MLDSDVMLPPKQAFRLASVEEAPASCAIAIEVSLAQRSFRVVLSRQLERRHAFFDNLLHRVNERPGSDYVECFRP